MGNSSFKVVVIHQCFPAFFLWSSCIFDNKSNHLFCICGKFPSWQFLKVNVKYSALPVFRVCKKTFCLFLAISLNY